jgi:hypothetical protein
MRRSVPLETQIDADPFASSDTGCSFSFLEADFPESVASDVLSHTSRDTSSTSYRALQSLELWISQQIDLPTTQKPTQTTQSAQPLTQSAKEQPCLPWERMSQIPCLDMTMDSAPCQPGGGTPGNLDFWDPDLKNTFSEFDNSDQVLENGQEAITRWPESQPQRQTIVKHHVIYHHHHHIYHTSGTGPWPIVGIAS